MKNTIVSVDWLYRNLKNEDVIILDASMVTDVSDLMGTQQIPGSIFFDLKNIFCDKNSSFPNTIPEEKQFELACQKLGINQNSIIIVYDRKGIYSSPRVWWLFKLMGHKSIAVLNGGFPEWVSSNYPVEFYKPNRVAKGEFVVRKNDSIMKDYSFMIGTIEDASNQVIDVRSADRFNSIVPEIRKGLRSGNIPSSINIPYSDVLVKGKFKGNEELRNLFTLVVDMDKQSILSCGSGITACIVFLALELINYDNISVYDGSWTEWGHLYDE